MRVVEYESRPNRRRPANCGKLKRIAKRAGIGVLLVVFPYATWQLCGETVQRLYWRAKANSYEIPPELVVAEENPRRARELVWTPDGHLNPAGHLTARRSEAAIFSPYILSGKVHYLPDLYFLIQDSHRGLAFLHRLCSSNGDSRLVIVGASPESSNALDGSKADMLISAWTLLSGKPWRVTGTELRFPAELGEKRVYGGQCDEHDPSHFTIKYEINDKIGMIDGWLQSDDTVKLRIRDGPASRKRG